MTDDTPDGSADDEVPSRREFLKKCGKYAVVVPPTMTVLLARSPNATAQDQYGGGECPSPAEDLEGFLDCVFNQVGL